VPFRIACAPISAARSAAVVSVVKYGLPVPAANTTTRPFSRCRMARRGMNGSATCDIVIAVWTRVRLPDRFERVLQRQRVDHRGEHAHVVGASTVHAARRARHAPARCLPPPTTTAISTPSSTRASATSSAMRCTTAASDPEVDAAVGKRLTRQLEDDAAIRALDRRLAHVIGR